MEITAAEVDTDRLVATRTQLHGIAECLLAGPEYRATREIALRIVPGGFATTADPDIVFSAGRLLAGDRHVPAVGTYAELAAAVGVEFGAPSLGYPDGSGVTAEDVVDLDPVATKVLTDWYELSDAALRMLSTEDPAAPILWPEHFDVAVEIGGDVYGSSPGDGFHAAPYAYVSTRFRDGSEFFDAPFGAARASTEFRTVTDLVEFWREGIRRISG